MGDYLNIGKYVIPLDAVDLSLLPLENILQIETNDYRPLWCKRDFDHRNEVAYYKFEIQERTDEPEPAKIEDEFSGVGKKINLDTYTCHICNLEVPQIYMADQVDSSKHKMFLTIANVALERIHRNLDQNTRNQNSMSAFFFCKICVSVVAVENRDGHLFSKAHNNAVRREKALQKLMQVYTTENGSTADVFPEEIEKCDKAIDNPVHDLKLEPVENVKKNDSVNTKSLKINDSSESAVKTVESSINFDELLKILNEKTKSSHVLKTLDDENYIIQMNDREIKVATVSFHGFEKVSKHRYRCKLCMSESFKKKTQMQHIMTEEHIEKICLPLKDENCIRKLDNVSSHCILCNEMIPGYLEHTVYSEVHSDRLNKLFFDTKDGFTAATPPEVKQIESSKVVTSTKDLLPENTEVIIDKEDKGKKADSIEQKSNIGHASNPDRSSNKYNDHYFIKKSSDDGHFTCEICHTQGTSREIESHIIDPTHITLRSSVFAKNDMFIVDNQHLFCCLCSMVIEKGNETAHIISDRHAVFVSRFSLRSEQIAQKSTAKIDSGGEPANMSSENQSQKTLAVKVYLCQICNVKVPNNPHNVNMHERGGKHKNMLAKLNDQKYSAEKVLGNSENKAKVAKDSNNKIAKAVQTGPGNSNSKIVNQISISDTNSVTGQKQVANEKSSTIANNIKQNETKNETLVQVPRTNEMDPTTIKQLISSILEMKSNVKEIKCNICSVVIPYKEKNVHEHLKGVKHNNELQKLDVKNAKMVNDFILRNVSSILGVVEPIAPHQ